MFEISRIFYYNPGLTICIFPSSICSNNSQIVMICVYFQYLYELGWHVRGQIAVTQPRRVSALTLADRVASERGEILGDTVGVSVSFIDKYSDTTAIKVNQKHV